jgi:rhodanese-related sulfurtransferase
MTVSTPDVKELRPVAEVTPEMLEQWLAQGDTVLVDVREDFEHGTERIEGAHHFALSSFDPEAVRKAHGTRRVVFHCRTGRRSVEAADAYRAGDEHVFHLAGGIQAWKAAGRKTARPAGAPRIDVMRQVQMTAGSLVLGGVLLGAFVNPWFLVLSGFVGGGLVFAGASGWCGMAMLLARMPWNRRASSSCAVGSSPGH